MKRVRLAQIVGPGAALALGLASCGGAAAPPRGGAFTPDAGTTTVTIGSPLCTKARASEDLKPRVDLTGITTGTTMPGPQLVHTSDLFVRFRAICGGCHVEASTGGKHVTEATFADVFDGSWLATIKSDTKYMPPAPVGKPYSMRTGNDPVVTLVKYLEAWLSAGRPKDVFMIDASVLGGAMTSTGYGFAPTVASSFTNLGNCVTNAAGFESSTSGVMESMDKFWEDAKDLPQTLADTDLTTFDSEVLAATGVISFVPTYPLWSAGSGKLRHIRVPRGQHVTFDKATQSFSVPPNTRFYKTFFRKVVDRAGQLTNRKMETRLIVARPARTLADGTVEQTALFGTYVWSEDETTATLANLPYRDGTPFADQVRTYITDELAYQDIVDSISVGANFDGALADALKRNPDIQHHYAIPGRVRCVQCHMGSPMQNFVLGFIPLQIARRATGTGGTYEPTGDDEMTQLQRLIDYGVITGMTSPEDVLPLELSEGSRRARTEGELNAQAYMVGNCAHCHNPHGLPSVTKPELVTLNFLPGAPDGGVFEMPFEKMSPIRARGAGGDIPIPYITPSLRDYPVATTEGIRVDNQQGISADFSQGATTWTPKYDMGAGPKGCADNTRETRAYCGTRKSGPTFVAAPWRSLIYRNVDSPFPYFDDYVPFPHMPMNTFGFDCRAPRIMGDWMVGLPAARKAPAISDDALPTPILTVVTYVDEFGVKQTQTLSAFFDYDREPQPYVEVKPGDRGYAEALDRARARLDEYHASVRYNYCEDVLSPDIFDPVISETTPSGYRPAPDRFLIGGTPPLDPTRPGEYIQPAIGVPYHSHFFPYDPTDAPPPWSPRRPEWATSHLIVPPLQDDPSPPAGGNVLTDATKADRRLVATAINEASFSDDLKAYATKEIPYGLWQVKPECADKLAKQPKVSAFTGANRPAWMDLAKAPADAPVYMISPGAALYRHICINCHGPKADGKGLQADALAASSEGEARPANFHEGLFGPSDSPGTNLRNTFAIGVGGQDAVGWGSRYMAWMALGGTLKVIPQDIIHQVEATTILGERRPNLHLIPGAGEISANMLNLAKGLCAVVLPDAGKANDYFNNYTTFKGVEPYGYPPYNADVAPFIGKNEDKEMWIQLCTQFSPAVVRVYELHGSAPTVEGADDSRKVVLGSMFYADGYPSTAPVLDHRPVVVNGVNPTTNYYPACVRMPTDPRDVSWLQQTRLWTFYKMPPCPAEFLQNGKLMWHDSGTPDEVDQWRENTARWDLRGAIAAGMSVFSYLYSAGGAQMEVKPYYNQCQLLK
jgi:mono/diheme cytochrome c family protein